ncbi:hypothetical protein HUJ04_013404 [Dendroctonus ponderosae]|nr:hypothetical protein HUJ04_013404 [Dendroctonus ponderosae]
MERGLGPRWLTGSVSATAHLQRTGVDERSVGQAASFARDFSCSRSRRFREGNRPLHSISQRRCLLQITPGSTFVEECRFSWRWATYTNSALERARIASESSPDNLLLSAAPYLQIAAQSARQLVGAGAQRRRFEGFLVGGLHVIDVGVDFAVDAGYLKAAALLTADQRRSKSVLGPMLFRLALLLLDAFASSSFRFFMLRLRMYQCIFFSLALELHRLHTHITG